MGDRPYLLHAGRIAFAYDISASVTGYLWCHRWHRKILLDYKALAPTWVSRTLTLLHPIDTSSPTTPLTTPVPDPRTDFRPQTRSWFETHPRCSMAHGVYNQYYQVPALGGPETNVQSLGQLASDHSRKCQSCQGLQFCPNAPTVPNTAAFHNDNFTSGVLHHFSFPSPLSIPGTSSTLEVALISVFRKSLGALNADPDHAISEPMVDAALSLYEDKWPPAERMYATAYTPPLSDTHQYSTNSTHRPTQYDSDSLAITLQTASVSPYKRSLSPRQIGRAHV